MVGQVTPFPVLLSIGRHIQRLVLFAPMGQRTPVLPHLCVLPPPHCPFPSHYFAFDFFLIFPSPLRAPGHPLTRPFLRFPCPPVRTVLSALHCATYIDVVVPYPGGPLSATGIGRKHLTARQSGRLNDCESVAPSHKPFHVGPLDLERGASRGGPYGSLNFFPES